MSGEDDQVRRLLEEAAAGRVLSRRRWNAVRLVVVVGVILSLLGVTIWPPLVLVEEVKVEGKGFETVDTGDKRPKPSQELQVVVAHLGRRSLPSILLGAVEPRIRGGGEKLEVKTDRSRLLAEYALIVAIGAFVVQFLPRLRPATGP